MSVSTLSFSATLPPFNSTSGYNNNFSNTNLSATGNLSVSAGATASNPIVTGSATVNGINFNEQNATQTGNQLKVTYQSNEVNKGVTSPSTVNLNGGGVNFSPSNATTHGSNVTTTYNTSPNSNFNVPINGNAISSGNSSNGQTITLESLALVGNTLTATYQFSDNLPNNSIQASSAVPIQNTATVTALSPSAVNSTGATFSSRGLSSIGDVLAASNGITFNGTLTGALQQPPSVGQANAVPDPKASLAAALNPNLNLAPNNSLSVTDFVNVSPNAFPTSAPADTFSNSNSNNNNAYNPYDASDNNSNTLNSRSTNSSSSQNSSNSSNYGSSQAQNTGSQVGIYNAVSNANASTIRGSGLNTVA